MENGEKVLQLLGWNPQFQSSYASLCGDSTLPARVVAVEGDSFRLDTGVGEVRAATAGSLRHRASEQADLPSVGDWVVVQIAAEGGIWLIRHVLPRLSTLSRAAPDGRRSRSSGSAAGVGTVQQILAANVDTAFIVVALDGDFNLRRIERYLLTVWEGGVTPVILLNKADLCPDIDARRREVANVAVGVPIHALSAVGDDELVELQPYLAPGQTVAFMGSSGVGKSTIINRLLAITRAPTRPVRSSDGRGRHTTTTRELFQLESGGMVIDNPGIRELYPWAGAEALDNTFADVHGLASGCRYRNCRHGSEPGCAVRQAVRDGRLSEQRFQSYRKLHYEVSQLPSHLEGKQLERKRGEKKRKRIKMHLKAKGKA